ncbi:MAG: helix-turn-helix domain-containing protein [Mariniphaga sp.]
MLPYLSLTGIILSVILMYYNTRNFKSSIYLSLYFLIISLYGLNQYVLLYSKSVFWVTVFCTHFTFLYYLVGPLFYWYIRSVLTDNPRFSRWDLLHLLPMLVFLIVEVPYLLAPLSYKSEIATRIAADPEYLGEINFTILSDIFSNAVVYLSRPVLILGYLIWSFGMFIHFITGRKRLHIIKNQRFITKWLSVLFGFTFILFVSYIILLFRIMEIDSMVLFYTANTLQILSAAGLAGLVISPLFFPEIMYGLPRIPQSIVNQEIQQGGLEHLSDTEETSLIFTEERTQSLHFENEYMVNIQQKVEDCMKEFQPYLQPQLNLNKFADILQLPAHHLAYFFREFRHQSFNDYNNECRVRHARNLMVEGKTEELTLEAVGLLSGFTNRSTFFRAFKKAEGISPRDFLAKFNQNSSPNT